MSNDNYREVAKSLDVHYLFGRWGIDFGSRLPGSSRIWRIRLIPLDGWITDPREVEQAIRENGMEL